MVAYLEKSDENAEFHQIVDFLSTCSINYALTISPTIYASYIEQFWNTATSKTVNFVKQMHARVDGRAIVISESSVRSDLLFNDGDGKVTPLFDSMLVQNQVPEGEGSTIPPEPQPTPSTSQPIVSEPQIETPPTAAPQTEVSQAAVSQIVFHDAHIKQIPPSLTTYQRKRKTHKRRKTKKDTELPQTSVPQNLGADEAVHKEGVTGIDTGGSPRGQDTMGGAPAQTWSKRVLEQPSKLPLPEGHTSGSREDNMEHIFELTDIVLDLENEKDAQAVEILKLKKRVKKLKRQRKSSISHSRRRTYRKVESSDDDLDEDDASKQRRSSDKTKQIFQDS
ncbi:hypothetical protein Tco_1424944, partial [Tanacetum coccineum]